LAEKHQVVHVDLSTGSSNDGTVTLRRLVALLRVYWDVARHARSADRAYLTISESVAGNLKDMLVYVLLLGRWRSLFLHLHGGSIGHQVLETHPVLRRLNAAVFERAGGIIISGDSHRAIFSGPAPTARLHVVPNFAPDCMFRTIDEVRARFAQPQPLRVLFLSNMYQEKGYLDLLDGFLALPLEIRQRMELDFAGKFYNPTDRASFEARLAGLPGVRYHGVVTDEQKRALFARAHLFCLPTRFREGQPVSIIEAYASGCVVLTTSQPGINDVFRDGTNGHYVGQASPGSIMEALARCVHEPARLLEIALQNRATAETSYRIGAYVSGIEALMIAGPDAGRGIPAAPDPH
jgi:glycosyltransferase involved in cell wall biosynthesis